MRVPAESLSGSSVRDKVVTAAEAVRLVRDGDSVAVVDGFMAALLLRPNAGAGAAVPADRALPATSGWCLPWPRGNRLGRGLDRLADKGLLKRAVGGHWALSPALGKMAVDNAIEAHNLPQGVISQLFRDTAAASRLADPGGENLRRPAAGRREDQRADDRGPRSADHPRRCRSTCSTRRCSSMWRSCAAPLRIPGNITMEREALIMEALAVATAVHNVGGLVIVQVERVAENGSLSPREVKIPGILVDCVARSAARAPLADLRHAILRGAERRAAAGPQLGPAAGADRAEGHRPPGGDGAPAKERGDLGIGIPEGVADVAAEEHILDYLTLTAEPGAMGGMPAWARISARLVKCASHPGSALPVRLL